MSARKWNFYYDEKENRFTTKHFVNIASLWIGIILLWVAFLIIIKEQFPNFTGYVTYVYDTDSYRQASLVKKMIGLDWFTLILFMVILWLPNSGFLPEKWRKRTILCHLCSLVIPVFYTITNWEKVVQGMLSVAKEYITRFNPYNGMNISVPMGTPEHGPVAFTLLLMVLWMVVWGIAMLTKRKVLLVLFPLIAVFSEFLVGASPTGNGIFVIFVAALLLLIPEGTQVWKHGVVLAMAVLSVLFTTNHFKDDIERLSGDKNIIDDWIAEFKVPDWQFEKWFTLTFQLSNESLTNNRPSYTGETVLQINCISIPSSKLYLRGFCGTEYKNGNWSWDTDSFKKACKEAGYSTEQVINVLSKMPFDTVVKSQLSRRMAYTITYVGATGNIAYLPYYFDYTTLDEEYNFIGDYLARKTVGDTQIKLIGTYLGDVTEARLYMPYTKDAESYDTMLWYNEMAQTYAQSTTDLECIKEAAEYIKNRIEYPTKNAFIENYPEIFWDEDTLPVLLENEYRMILAQSVRNYLADRMSYSVMLDDLPRGADPVEYALTVSHEGYCMHYATAAALIMKELGVPTRYVSGYVVRPGDFKYLSESYSYVSYVPDHNAHAWIEIYLDNVGWVPVEVTEGYSSDTDTIPTKVSPNRWELISEANRELYEDGRLPLESETIPTETEEVLPSESESGSEVEPATEDSQTEDNQTGESQSTDTQRPQTEPEDSESESDSITGQPSESDTDEKGGTGDSKNQGLPKNFYIILSAVLVFLAVVGIVYTIRTNDALFVKELKRTMDREQTRRAVSMMNRRVYRRVRWERTGHLNDEEYLQALIEICKVVEPKDWERYMEIVKKTHYSKENITVEEMMHCYWCCKAIAPGRYGNS